MNEIKYKRQYLRDESRKFSASLVEIPCNSPLAELYPSKAPKRAWRSREFLVQLFHDPSGLKRLSINRAEINSEGGWKDGITWDELQRLKNEAGFGEVQAIEFYPPDADLVYDANIRHLWLMFEPLTFAWTRENASNPVPISIGQ
jgi:hypothetical protein